MGYDTLIQGAHVARNILMTLSGRPISISNTAYVVSSLRSLQAIAWAADEAAAGLDSSHRDSCRQFARLLEETVRQPTAPQLARMRHYIENDLPLYATLRQMPYEFDACPPRPFRGRSYKQILVMIGPGIGIGDEVSYTAFFRALADHFRVPPECVEIFTFSPGLWEALSPEFVTRGLSGSPLDFFQRLRRCLTTSLPSQVLIAYASFMGQEMHRCLLPYRDRLDVMEVGLASAQAWLKLRGHERGVTWRGRNQKSPNMIRALDELLAHLLGRGPRIASQSTHSYCASSDRVFRIFVNPFTSKFSPLTPRHWAEFIAEVRSALPRKTMLVCRVSPGFSPWCGEYAHEVVGLTRQFVKEGIKVSVLGESGGATIDVNNGIAAMQRAVARADFVLAIDTYTAHLAAYSNTVSLALCLNRNPEFWQPAVHTFWVDLHVGHRTVSTMIRALVKLITRRFTADPSVERYARTCRDLVELGHPLQLTAPDGNGSRVRLRNWASQADVVWESLPKPLAGILDAVDADHSWRRLAASLSDTNANSRRVALAKLAESSFFRLACLAAGEGSTRGNGSTRKAAA
jgi:hypothetical protein